MGRTTGRSFHGHSPNSPDLDGKRLGSHRHSWIIEPSLSRCRMLANWDKRMKRRYGTCIIHEGA